MELLLDTANIALIAKYNANYNITGVTSNPTIIARERAAFFPTLCRIREIIGDKQLHVQVTAPDHDGMMREAVTITSVLGKDTYIKVPTTQVGVGVMKSLKEKGYRVTATAIYSLQQAALAASVNADYAAPYVNRICNAYGNADAVVSDMAELFAVQGVQTKILGASFKNTDQIIRCLLSGAQAVTASPELYTTMVESPLIDAAVKQFECDWVGLYGECTIDQLPLK